MLRWWHAHQHVRLSRLFGRPVSVSHRETDCMAHQLTRQILRALGRTLLPTDRMLGRTSSTLHDIWQNLA